ncbi:MAG: alpha/beta hydrolase [Paludibacteraceae bacterium]|nr:alpha/beta hydrolase [Paludibacteraceae bacterium]
MKKNFLLLLAIVAGFVGCNKNELPIAPVDEERMVDFSVIEESDVSSTDFYNAVMSPLKTVEGVDLSELQRAYDATAGRQMVADNNTLCLPLFYRIARITYVTKDAANQDVTVSAQVIYPLLRKINKVMLVNHGTHMGIAMVPTYMTSVEAIVAASGALCILPDYIGVGASSSHPDLYLNAEVHGRTSTDALFALLAFAKQKNVNLDKKFDTYILGYSQGGSVSLATLRTIQSLPASQQAQLRIKKVICGDGPYDLRCTFESFVADEQAGKTMGLGSVVPLVINSMFNSYPDEMGQYNYEDFFTPWALSTGVPQAVRNNDETICDMMIRLNDAKLSDILNMDYVENNPEAYNTLLSMMDRQNLCNGWQPRYPLQFFHCNPDGIVSYNNFVNAYTGLRNSYVLTPDTPSSSIVGGNPLLQHIYGMTVMLSNVLLGKYY